MRLSSFLLSALFMAVAVNCAWGHGFSIALSGNDIVTLNAAPNYFRHEIEFDGVFGSVTEFQSVHGAFSANSASFPMTTRGFNTDDTFAFRLVGPLWFSNGGPATAATSRVSLTGTDVSPLPAPAASTTALNGQSSGFTPGFPLSGINTHEIEWILGIDNFTAADNGVYGFAYEVQGYAHGNTNSPYDPLFVHVQFHTPDFETSPNLLAAQEAVYAASSTSAAAAVPEPSGFAAMLLGLGLFVALAWRSRRARAM